MKLLGIEPITGTQSRLVDYWAWAHSTLLDNLEYSVFAEFLVHVAMNASAETRPSAWDNHDIISPEGIRISVKSSKSQIFNITSRSSDFYVFSLNNYEGQEDINILDTRQWTFFVIPTSQLNAEVKSITLKRLKELNAIETDYASLRKTILEMKR